jgi:hypothetical protein
VDVCCGGTRRREHGAWRTATCISENRNLLANLKPHDRLEQAFLDHGIVSVKSFDHLIVGSPPHPFRFWRQFPFVRVEATNRAKPRFDLRRAPMTPGDGVHKLRSVSDFPAPPLSTRERISAGRHPQHGRETFYEQCQSKLGLCPNPMDELCFWAGSLKIQLLQRAARLNQVHVSIINLSAPTFKVFVVSPNLCG